MHVHIYIKTVFGIGKKLFMSEQSILGPKFGFRMLRTVSEIRTHCKPNGSTLKNLSEIFMTSQKIIEVKYCIRDVKKIAPVPRQFPP